MPGDLGRSLLAVKRDNHRLEALNLLNEGGDVVVAGSQLRVR